MSVTDMLEKVAREIAKARYLHDYGEPLEERFVEGLAARCAMEAQAALDAIGESHVVVPREPQNLEALDEAVFEIAAEFACPITDEFAREFGPKMVRLLFSAMQEKTNG